MLNIYTFHEIRSGIRVAICLTLRNGYSPNQQLQQEFQIYFSRIEFICVLSPLKVFNEKVILFILKQHLDCDTLL